MSQAEQGLGVDTLHAHERKILRELIRDCRGVVGASHRIGTSRESLARAAAGLAVRRGTLALIRAALASREPDRAR